MIPKNYPYVDIDGNHWPDSALGDELYYSIDYSEWLQDQNDSLREVVWNVPEGLEGEDAYEAEGQAYIKLTALKRGSFTVTCELHTIEKSKRQVKTVPMVLKVY